jgi:hypothetical protein
LKSSLMQPVRISRSSAREFDSSWDENLPYSQPSEM